jgi:hypothetical protein
MRLASGQRICAASATPACSGALMLFSGITASAYTLDNITIVLSDEGGAYEEFANHLNSLLQPSNKTSVRLLSLKNMANDEFSRATANQLVIAVGTPAMVAMAQKPASNPVLNVLVPRATFIKTAKQYNRSQDQRRFSAVYMDQSWSRQLRLIRATMPHAPKSAFCWAENRATTLPPCKAQQKKSI